MKKDFITDVESLTDKTNELKKNIIAAIKDYMNEHGITRFMNWFPDVDLCDDWGISEIKNEDEYNSLFREIVGDFDDTSFMLYYDHFRPVYFRIDDDGELVMEGSIENAAYEPDWDKDSLSIYGEKTMIQFSHPFSLNQCLLNLQNEKFHRMNELINNN